MTVTRVGPAQAPHRTELGPVLVTIDDLDALMTHLTKPEGTELQAEFDGGIFTEAADLRILSDAEMGSLRLKNSEVQVVLSPTDAFAVGDFVEAEEVYRVWARARKTQLRPQPLQRRNMVPTYIAIALYLTGLLGALGVTFGIPLLTGTKPTSFGYVTGGYVFISAVIINVFWRSDRRRNSSSYAVVIPLSLAEHRQTRSTQMYPRRSWIVAIIAAIIAAVAVAAAVWIKVTSK